MLKVGLGASVISESSYPLPTPLLRLLDPIIVNISIISRHQNNFESSHVGTWQPRSEEPISHLQRCSGPWLSESLPENKYDGKMGYEKW